MERRRGYAVLAISMLCAVAGCDRTPADAPAREMAPAVKRAGDADIQYTPLDDDVLIKDPAVIDAWIQDNDADKITKHAWDLWKGVTRSTSESVAGTPLPVWETWYDSTMVYDVTPSNAGSRLLAPFGRMKGSNPRHRLHPPVQLITNGTVPRDTPGFNTAALVLTNNRFNQEMFNLVQNNNFDDRATLDKENNASYDSIADRNISPLFPNTSVMMKPVFVLVSGSEATALPYWTGTGGIANPTQDTWTRCVLVLPPNVKTPPAALPPCNDTAAPSGGYQVVRVGTDPEASDFYAFQLTQQEIDDLGRFVDRNDLAGAKAGDYAVFVATHLATRETSNWTWQTFWWQPPGTTTLPSEPPNASLAPQDGSVTGPWKNFAACTAYSMAPDASGNTPRCYNPYLETVLVGLFDQSQMATTTGINSNCMSCHRAAAWPQVQFLKTTKVRHTYAANFPLDPGDPLWFEGKLKTDFVWTMIDFVQPKNE